MDVAAGVGTLLLMAVLAACGSTMVERDGRRVFNPRYLPFLETRRDRWQRPEAVIDELALPRDAVVADVGAGSGYFTAHWSRHLSEGGRVYATDVQQPMLDALRRRIERESLDNVEVVRAGFDDPGLPEACCDLVFFSSVYKEIVDRPRYMRRVRALLRPGGRVAILEFLPDAPGPGPPRDVRLSPETITAEMREAGFVRVASYDVVATESFQVFAPGPPAPSPDP